MSTINGLIIFSRGTLYRVFTNSHQEADIIQLPINLNCPGAELKHHRGDYFSTQLSFLSFIYWYDDSLYYVCLPHYTEKEFLEEFIEWELFLPENGTCYPKVIPTRRGNLKLKITISNLPTSALMLYANIFLLKHNEFAICYSDENYLYARCLIHGSFCITIQLSKSLYDQITIVRLISSLLFIGTSNGHLLIIKKRRLIQNCFRQKKIDSSIFDIIYKLPEDDTEIIGIWRAFVERNLDECWLRIITRQSIHFVSFDPYDKHIFPPNVEQYYVSV